MQLRVFSVVGEALNFGLRRMETIMRIAWLPVALILVLDMTTLFSLLSVALGRLVTFSDAATYVQAQNALPKLWSLGVEANPVGMGLVLAASYAVQAILIASFMAPLIRLSGLAEHPSSGVVKLEFGPSQMRFLFAGLASVLAVGVLLFLPAGVTSFYALNYVRDAMEAIYVSFPNAESLHTVEILSGRDVVAARGEAWIYSLAVPSGLLIPFGLAFWTILVLHFHPRNRQSGAERANILARAIGALVGGGAIVGLVWLWLLGGAKIAPNHELALFYLFGALLIVIFYYLNLRLTPYLGVVVCRKSLAPAGTLRVTRGWNILRLFAILILLSLVTLLVQWAINAIVFPSVLSTLTILNAATGSATKLANGGVEAEWVRPLFIWLLNGFKILVNLVWQFFTFGVVAGLLGRLYRESERGANSE
ncbi:MAG: hypothetical protein AB7P23_12810 [Amphiplicatus sp.]